jgi:cyclopropane-fatty-acyl-phospholipid synthase
VTLAIELCERGIMPDALMRIGMRRLMRDRLVSETRKRSPESHAARLADLRASPVAIDTDKANEQHYEVPAGFFLKVLGPHLKYSSCWFESPMTSLAEAEAAMLALTCERASLADGQRVLELGCGWGSLTLWMASHYPRSRITAVSNSRSQREFILARAAERSLGNIEVITADANVFDTADRFDRVVSVEMFEHLRNYAVLMERISRWLNADGQLFVHIFCHRTLLYPFTTGDDYDWMARYFFTGGQMPAEDTLAQFQDHLRLEQQWRVPGTHYQRTAEAWLANMDANEDAVRDVLGQAYGAEAGRWFNRWRMFFLAVAELFGYAGGAEWFVAHYRFAHRSANGVAGAGAASGSRGA